MDDKEAEVQTGSRWQAFFYSLDKNKKNPDLKDFMVDRKDFPPEDRDCD